MVEQISRIVFFICLYVCALLVLFLIWTGGPETQSPYLFQTAASLFVVGLAAFLTWFFVCVSRSTKGR